MPEPARTVATLAKSVSNAEPTFPRKLLSPGLPTPLASEATSIGGYLDCAGPPGLLRTTQVNGSARAVGA